MWKQTQINPKYEVNEDGEVRTIATGHIKSQKTDRYGYKVVCLSEDKFTRKYVTVHRLVATAFIPNPDNLPQVNHKDENKTNNHVSNLEWCTASYNVNYGNAAVERGLKQRNDRNKSKLTAMYTLDGNLVDIYPSAREASRLTVIPKTLIYKCCRGENKTAKRFLFKYFNNN